MRTLQEIAKDLQRFATSIQGFSLDHWNHIRRLADEITERHDHADPCDNPKCPCFAAGMKAGKPPLRYPGMRAG